MSEAVAIEGDPFSLARSSCQHAVEVARDVSVNQAAVERFAEFLDVRSVREILHTPMGENCDTLPDEFENGREAANFAIVFSLAQLGHGFRYELHQLCGRGASQTVTLGIRTLHSRGGLGAKRLQSLTGPEIYDAFVLPSDPMVATLAQQLQAVLNQAGMVLERLGFENFADFCQANLPDGVHAPAATIVRQLANHFPAFNDQAILHDGSRVVLLKKAALATGELRRLAGPHESRYLLDQDFRKVIAPVDNVIPAMLVYRGILLLSPRLHRTIHKERTSLPRGGQEAELRAVALAACERVLAAAGNPCSALQLGYYLWRSGKEPGARQFARHHTRDTVFY
jgi:hypothetical protein